VSLGMVPWLVLLFCYCPPCRCRRRLVGDKRAVTAPKVPVPDSTSSEHEDDEDGDTGGGDDDPSSVSINKLKPGMLACMRVCAYGRMCVRCYAHRSTSQLTVRNASQMSQAVK
jgi:hypothetical protein